MTYYDIYGVGGALVDTEVFVSDKFLNEAKIRKGSMTLVDELRQDELISTLNSHDFKMVKKSGGSVCNSVVAASHLGASTFFGGKVADDIDGKLFVSDLEKSGVDFHSISKEKGKTGKCLVLVTDDAERTMNTFLGISETWSERELKRDVLQHSEWFYIEGYLITDRVRASLIKSNIEFAKKFGVKVAISLSDSFVVNLFRESIIDVMREGVDLIFCNKDEALSLTETTDLERATEKLSEYAKSFVITDGSNGALIYDSKVVFKSNGVAVEAIDTNGAGDMFAGAFLYAITSGKSYSWAAELANTCAAMVVKKFGPRLTFDEFEVIKKEFGI